MVWIYLPPNEAIEYEIYYAESIKMRKDTNAKTNSFNVNLVYIYCMFSSSEWKNEFLMFAKREKNSTLKSVMTLIHLIVGINYFDIWDGQNDTQWPT